MTLHDMSSRVKAQIRPVWDGTIADAANSEQFTNIDIALAEELTIPVGCTGITIALHDPGVGTGLFIYPTGGVLGAATSNNAGILLTDTNADFIVDGVVIGDRVRNVTDGSFGTVTGTAATALNIAAGLSGGSANTWRIGDVYRVETLAGPRVLLEGGANNDKSEYFPLVDSWPTIPGKSFYLLAEVATQDADVFYHFD